MTDKPNLTRVWAKTAPGSNVVDPDTVTAGKFAAGWQAEVPPFEYFNFIQKQVTEGLAHINEQGIAVWDADTVYPVAGLAKGSDGNVYKALISQSDNDPVSDGGTNWIDWEVSNRVIRVTSVAAMMSFSLPTDALVQTIGFYAAGDGSSALYRWDASTDKSTHNGGRVIDPTHSVSPGAAGWWTAENSGLGVFRVDADFISIENYGAIPGTDCTDAAKACFLNERNILLGAGTHEINDTVIVGSPGRTVFKGVSRFQSILKAGATLDTAEKPIIALNADYDLSVVNFSVDSFEMLDVKVEGNLGLDGRMPNENAGADGVDISWTKDGIRFIRCAFNALKNGVFAREGNGDISHWGSYFEDCHFISCYTCARIYPNIGGFDKCDFQYFIRGIHFDSSQAYAGVLQVNNSRIEVSGTKPASVSDDVVGITLSGRVSVQSTYFEGMEYHLYCTGGNNLQVSVIGGKVSTKADTIASIYWGASSSQSSITLTNLYATEQMFSYPALPNGAILMLGAASGNYKLHSVDGGSWTGTHPDGITFITTDTVRGFVFDLNGAHLKNTVETSNDSALIDTIDSPQVINRRMVKRSPNLVAGDALVEFDIAALGGYTAISAEVTVTLDRQRIGTTFCAKWLITAGEEGGFGALISEISSGPYVPTLEFSTDALRINNIENTSFDTFSIYVDATGIENDPANTIIF